MHMLRNPIGPLVLVPLTTFIAVACQCGSPCRTAPRGTGLESEVCIPAGTFKMGHPPLLGVNDPNRRWNPQPANDWTEHEVSLDAYYIDAYPVTWGRYRRCVEAGVCPTNGLNTFPSTRMALLDPAMSDHPASNIHYDEAMTFCLWSGKRLPTESEWERAGRGPEGFDYPWGNKPPGNDLLSARTFYGPGPYNPAWYPAVVGTLAQDVSAEGVHDMFGGTPEWVADWYDPNGYLKGPSRNPKGPSEAVVSEFPLQLGAPLEQVGARVVRGDRWNRAGGTGWDTEQSGAPLWFRKHQEGGMGTGFRCARDDSPADAARPGGWVYPTIHVRTFGGKRGAP